MGLKIEFAEDGRIIDQYDDSLSRETVSKAMTQIDNLKCESNGELYEVDIKTEDKHIIYEIEYAKSQKGDRWAGNQNDLFKIGRDTTNCVERKFYMWGFMSKDRTKKNHLIHKYDGIIVHFVRVNAFHNQIIVIRDHIMRDPTKRELIENYLANNSTSEEDFWAIYREFCETYNLQMGGRWVRDTEPDGKYEPRMSRGARIARGEI
jgi:hypothetical protein